MPPYALSSSLCVLTLCFVSACCHFPHIGRSRAYHCRHPGQLAATSISYSTLLHTVSTPYVAPFALALSHTRPHVAAKARITKLEAKIARLHSKCHTLEEIFNVSRIFSDDSHIHIDSSATLSFGHAPIEYTAIYVVQHCCNCLSTLSPLPLV